MREIKFRAWDKVRNRVSQVISPYINSDGSFAHVSIDDRKESCDTLFQGEFEIMQYTGLKDKLMVEIYEGDIWKTDFMVGAVEFENGCFVFRAHDKPYAMTARDHNLKEEEFEIIGNIYEHPHLLNSDKEDKRSVATKA